MEFITNFISLWADVGALFFKTLFEHPDYDLLIYMKNEEAKYISADVDYNVSMNVLRNISQNLRANETTDEDTYKRLSDAIYDIQSKIEKLLLSMTEMSEPQRKKIYREAQLLVMEELKLSNHIDNITRTIEINNKQSINKKHLEQALKLKMSLYGNSVLHDASLTTENLAVKAFLKEQTDLAISAMRLKKDFVKQSMVVNYHNEGEDLVSLTTPTTTIEQVDNILTSRLEALQNDGRSRSQTTTKTNVQAHEQLQTV
uniref:Uncharacterized protein n=1 Tax=Ranid herpesvirus 4 TaxID=2849006 RepID=A0A8F3CIJ6_9VIRU|nr:MAG: hypothetical protein [Ranid herpesvirus 4]